MLTGLACRRSWCSASSSITQWSTATSSTQSGRTWSAGWCRYRPICRYSSSPAWSSATRVATRLARLGPKSIYLDLLCVCCRLVVDVVVNLFCCTFVVYFTLSSAIVVPSASCLTNPQQIEPVEFDHLLDCFDLLYSLWWICCRHSILYLFYSIISGKRHKLYLHAGKIKYTVCQKKTRHQTHDHTSPNINRFPNFFSLTDLVVNLQVGWLE